MMRPGCAALAAILLLATAGPATAELELHLTFDDPNNLDVDASGKNRTVEVVPEGGTFAGEITWVDDPVRGGVLEFPGGNNGWVYGEIPQLTGEFTVMMWAQRSPELCCGEGGANDGLFQVTFDGDPEIGPPTAGDSKVIGGWVQKSDAGLWGRMVQEDLTVLNLDRATYFMGDEEWVHLAYRGHDGEYEVFIDGAQGDGPLTDFDATIRDTDAIFVGKQGTETWGGLLDDVRVYSHALTIEEIQEAMMGGGGPVGTPGDLNNNGSLDAGDMDLLSAAVRDGQTPAGYDLNGDTVVDVNDRTFWIETLANSYFGDSNLDGEFNSGDLVAVFTVGEYEDAIAGNSGWADGDWNADTDFNSGDFVTAFSAGGYELGKRAATAAVPEPASISLVCIALLGLLGLRRI